MIGEDTFITTYILVVGAIFGAVFGSFINCMAWRISNGENPLKGRSHCTSCGHTLGVLDLIPIFSYIFLGGKCRYCKEKVSPRYMITELLMAVAFMLILIKFDVSIEALRYLVLICILLGLSLVDLETLEIPDGFIITGIVWWLVTIPIIDEPWQSELKLGLIGGFAVGGGMLVLSLLFDKVTGKESLGGGDIKLFFLVGLYLGPWVSLFNLIISCVIGIIFALSMNQKRIPFGPSIAAATFISILIGEDILIWYIGLL